MKTNEPLTPISLLTDGAFPTISCNKDLPEGLVLGADGTISGTPTVPSPADDYQITGTNNVETKSVTISITIEDNGCEALDEFPAAMNRPRRPLCALKDIRASRRVSVSMACSNPSTTTDARCWLLRASPIRPLR